MRPTIHALWFSIFLLFPPCALAGGWYLLEPNRVSVEEVLRRHPHFRDDWQIAKATLSLEAPFPRWRHVSSFDTAAECKAVQRKRYIQTHFPSDEAKSGLRQWVSSLLKTFSDEDRFPTIWDAIIEEGVSEEIRKKHPKLEGYLKGLQITYSLCIASDDPRLRGR